MRETKLTLTPSGFKTWKLRNKFIQNINIKIGKNNIKLTIIVPKNFETDLASVPRIFWILIPPFGRYSQAAVVHDYLYYSHDFSRKYSDKIFYHLMLRYGTYKWKAKLMYLAVRLFGRSAWI